MFEIISGQLSIDIAIILSTGSRSPPTMWAGEANFGPIFAQMGLNAWYTLGYNVEFLKIPHIRV